MKTRVGRLALALFGSANRVYCSMPPGLRASFFFGVRIRLGKILGRFSIVYFRGLGLRIRVMVMVWVRVRVRVRVWVRVSVMVRVGVSVVLWSG